MASANELTTELTRAVDLALAGDWDGAHTIVQKHEDDASACWVHAVLHKIEGDASNSRYWYGRAKRTYEDFADPKAELGAISELLHPAKS
jgi:hypothetical protein